MINLSLGGASRSLSIEQAVFEAVRRGALVVAASGNDGDEGNPLEYPAAVPHVLTVAATDRNDTVAPFSSRSGYVDLAAPGVEIPVARPTTFGGSYTVESGTSFAAPLVSAARPGSGRLRPELDASQVAETLRRSARDVESPGWDSASGYGMLDVPALLQTAAPTRDTREPNDDIGNVDPTADGFSGFPPLTTPVRTAVTAAGRLTRFDDPRDVFRLWLPRDRTVTLSVTADRPVTVQLFRQGIAQTVRRRRRDPRPARDDRPPDRRRLAHVREQGSRADGLRLDRHAPRRWPRHRLHPGRREGVTGPASRRPSATPLDDDRRERNRQVEHDVGLAHAHTRARRAGNDASSPSARALANASSRWYARPVGDARTRATTSR